MPNIFKHFLGMSKNDLFFDIFLRVVFEKCPRHGCFGPIFDLCSRATGPRPLRKLIFRAARACAKNQFSLRKKHYFFHFFCHQQAVPNENSGSRISHRLGRGFAAAAGFDFSRFCLDILRKSGRKNIFSVKNTIFLIKNDVF